MVVVPSDLVCVVIRRKRSFFFFFSFTGVLWPAFAFACVAFEHASVLRLHPSLSHHDRPLSPAAHAVGKGNVSHRVVRKQLLQLAKLFLLVLFVVRLLGRLGRFGSLGS
jgi:hypothetical protein